ncbi:hypothetical protein RUM43_012294 [Polyplax serrata]|uniref:Uncharacterized protein n=1 Tax=Polyplax serrata TaxID=468196 RepID=A0AAN8P6Y5_POLSC
MVGSAVLGAATGTGLALVIAMTIVVYRYYAHKRYGKEWSDLERFGDSRNSYTMKNAGYSITQKVSLQMKGKGLSSHMKPTIKRTENGLLDWGYVSHQTNTRRS